ncbi:MAG: hypothetical protein PHN35_00185 [Clostridia bacterium]|nr:hypothetical protein [Clostridia bacterium]MDD4798306.1 hypothetical protein [Clostridia bacterium]
MACFLVPAAEAVVVTVVAQVIKSKEKKEAKIAVNTNHANATVEAVEKPKISLSNKLMWLTRLLWGGAFLLAYEHVWHGEVVPWFPFLTAASDPAETSAMLQEMSTIGVTMAVIVTLTWLGIVLVSKYMTKKALKAKTTVV